MSEQAPERLTVESETGHANKYNSEDRKTRLPDVGDTPEYFIAEYIRADVHRTELEAVKRAVAQTAYDVAMEMCEDHVAAAVDEAIDALDLDEILKEARK